MKNLLVATVLLVALSGCIHLRSQVAVLLVVLVLQLKRGEARVKQRKTETGLTLAAPTFSR